MKFNNGIQNNTQAIIYKTKRTKSRAKDSFIYPTQKVNVANDSICRFCHSKVVTDKTIQYVYVIFFICTPIIYTRTNKCTKHTYLFIEISKYGNKCGGVNVKIHSSSFSIMWTEGEGVIFSTKNNTVKIKHSGLNQALNLQVHHLVIFYLNKIARMSFKKPLYPNFSTVNCQQSDCNHITSTVNLPIVVDVRSHIHVR